MSLLSKDMQPIGGSQGLNHVSLMSKPLNYLTVLPAVNFLSLFFSKVYVYLICLKGGDRHNELLFAHSTDACNCTGWDSQSQESGSECLPCRVHRAAKEVRRELELELVPSSIPNSVLNCCTRCSPHPCSLSHNPFVHPSLERVCLSPIDCSHSKLSTCALVDAISSCFSLSDSALLCTAMK